MAYFRIALSNIMEKAKNLSVWTEVGYTLFAEEGMDGIQVERLPGYCNLINQASIIISAISTATARNFSNCISEKPIFTWRKLQRLNQLTPISLCYW